MDTLFNQAIKVLKNAGAELIEIDHIGTPRVGYYSFQIMLYEYKDGLNKYFQSLGKNASRSTLKRYR